MLVGDGARQWARENNIEEVGDDSLKTEAMLKAHYHYKHKLNKVRLISGIKLKTKIVVAVIAVIAVIVVMVVLIVVVAVVVVAIMLVLAEEVLVIVAVVAVVVVLFKKIF